MRNDAAAALLADMSGNFCMGCFEGWGAWCRSRADLRGSVNDGSNVADAADADAAAGDLARAEQRAQAKECGSRAAQRHELEKLIS